VTTVESRLEVWEHDDQFGRRIRRLRARRGFTRQELAEKVGVSFDTVARWEETGRPPRSGEVLRALAEALDVTPGYLLLGEEDDD
jgi:transcriptional regulator with XRE-family HTH domain